MVELARGTGLDEVTRVLLESAENRPARRYRRGRVDDSVFPTAHAHPDVEDRWVHLVHRDR
jgi:hypothetical protein